MNRTTIEQWVAGVAVALMLPPGLVRAQVPEQGTTFSAEVTVTRAIVGARGNVVREMPGARYRLERQAGGRIRMTMRATKATPSSGPLADAYAGITVETGADGQLIVRDRNGRPLPAPAAGGAAMPLAVPADDDLGGIVVSARQLTARRQQLEARFGKSVGRVGRLDRYLSKRGPAVEEVLVAVDTGVPVEMNVVEGGALAQHHRFEYQAMPGGRLVRLRTRSESPLAHSPTDRLVSVTTLADVRLTEGAR